MKCEGIIPERSSIIGAEVINTAPEGEQPRYENRFVTETEPERPCEAEATKLARSIRQETCNLDGVHWVKDGQDRVYCDACFKPGTVTDLAGQTTAHPPMAVDEYER